MLFVLNVVSKPKSHFNLLATALFTVENVIIPNAITLILDTNS
jgi:hypothetical protein